MGALTSIGKSGLFASYAALQTASNNISNANTPGYSRQETKLADSPSQFTGSGFFGKGVTVTTVARNYDAYLTQQAVATASTAAADSNRQGKLNQLENVFPIGADGIGAAAGGFLNAFVEVSNNPGDSSARQVVLSQAQELASRVRSAGDQLNALQTGVAQDVRAEVDSLNVLSRQVAALNGQIGLLRGTGSSPNQLLDQRDELVKQIAQVVSVTSVQADDGTIGLFVGGGQSLVLGGTANTVKAVPDAFDPQKVALSMDVGGRSASIPPDNITGGAIAGLLRFQNDDLTTAKNLLGQLATAVSGQTNRQQALGLDLGRPARTGAPIFAVGAPVIANARGNNGNAALDLQITDATRLQPSDYELSFNGTDYALTRSSDRSAAVGSPFTPAQLAAGVQVDGMTVQLASGAAAIGDRFLLRPVASAAATMQTVLATPNGIAAASPFAGTANVDNTGTATIASLAATDPAYGGTLSAGFTFTDDAGAYAWTLSDGTSGSGQWTAGMPIALNGFQLQLAGVPKSGDRMDVAPTTSVISNNGNAIAIANLASTKFVATAGSSGASQTPTDAYAAAIANIGVRVQSGKTAESISGAAASQAETSRSNRDGVNLDEEAARLIQFQQSYQAAAKILQVAQQIFDAMLHMAAG